MPKVLKPVSTIKHEVWLPVVGLEEYYHVSNLGRIKSLERTDRLGRFHPEGLLALPLIGRYCQVRFSVDGVVTPKRVHQVVMEAFVGPKPKGMEVRHKDDDGSNNELSNLCYGTSKQNSNDQRFNKGFKYELSHQNGKLSNEQCDEIRRLKPGTIAKWAQEHGVSKGHVYNIRHGCRRLKLKD